MKGLQIWPVLYRIPYSPGAITEVTVGAAEKFDGGQSKSRLDGWCLWV